MLNVSDTVLTRGTTWHRLVVTKEAANVDKFEDSECLIRHVIAEARPESLRRQAIQGKTSGSPRKALHNACSMLRPLPQTVCSFKPEKQDILCRTAAIPPMSQYDGSQSLNMNGMMHCSLSGRNGLCSQRTRQASDIKKENGTSE